MHPIMLNLPWGISIKSYGMMMMLGFFAATWWAMYRPEGQGRPRRHPEPRLHLADLRHRRCSAAIRHPVLAAGLRQPAEPADGCHRHHQGRAGVLRRLPAGGGRGTDLPDLRQAFDPALPGYPRAVADAGPGIRADGLFPERLLLGRTQQDGTLGGDLPVWQPSLQRALASRPRGRPAEHCCTPTPATR